MCLYSVSIPMRDRVKAKAGDRLKVARYANHTCLINDAGAGKVACLLPGTKVVFKSINVNPAYYGGIETLSQPTGRISKARIEATIKGRDIEAELVRWNPGMTRYAADGFKLKDGTVLHLGWLNLGVQMTVGAKKPKPKAVRRDLEKLLNLDQIRADVPVKPVGTRKPVKA